MTKPGGQSLRNRPGAVRPGVVVQDGHCDFAGGVAGGVLVATGKVILEAGRAAAAAFFSGRGGHGTVHRLGGTEIYRR